MEEEIEKMEKQFDKRMKVINILIILLFILMAIVEIVKFITTKNGECLITALWVSVACNYWFDWQHERKWSDTKCAWRDRLIKALFKEINEKDEEIKKLKRGEK